MGPLDLHRAESRFLQSRSGRFPASALTAATFGAAWLAAAFIHLTALSQESGAPGPLDRPNFVLCMTDDQGWGDTSYNGHKVLKTPELDKIAASGLRFNRFYAAAPLCSPTRGSVLTGRHPNRFGCFSANFSMRPEEVTIAEALQNTGYAMAGHFGKWHVGPVKADSPVNPNNSGFNETLSHDNWFDLDPQLCHNGGPPRTFKGETSEIVMDAALEFIRQQATAKRAFLALVWFPSPHTPCQAVEKYKASYKHLSEQEQNYFGEIAAVDAAMGKLRKTLRDLGVADNTLVWFNSDNGCWKGDPGSTAGLRDRKGTLWEGGVRVPGLLEWPARIKKPMVTDIPCSTMDIYPTILDILGFKVIGQVRPLDGISLLPLIEGKMKERPKPIPFWQYRAAPRKSNPEQYLDAKAATGTWRTFRNDRHDEPRSADELSGHATLVGNRYKLHKMGPTRFELYDLAADPGETTDLAQESPEVVKDMAAALEAWQLSVEQSLTRRDYAAPAPTVR